MENGREKTGKLGNHSRRSHIQVIKTAKRWDNLQRKVNAHSRGPNTRLLQLKKVAPQVNKPTKPSTNNEAKAYNPKIGQALESPRAGRSKQEHAESLW